MPWFILSALVLARNGWRVFMHSFDGHTAGRLYTGETLRALGAPLADDLNEAARHLATQNFAFTPLEKFSRAIGADHVVAPDSWLALAGSHPGADAQSL